MPLFHLLILKKSKILSLIAIASTVNQNPVQKANIMYLSKEATNKDQSLKMQMSLSLDKEETNSSEKMWKKYVFFGD